MSGNRRRSRSRREGTALIVVMVMMMSLMILGLVVTQGALTQSKSIGESADAARALWAAEAAIGIKLAEIEATSGADVTGNTHTLADGTDVVLTVTQVGSDYQQIVSRATVNPGTVREATRTVEVYVKAAFHPLFYKATYVGNSHGVPGYKMVLGPSVGTTNGGATWTESTGRSGSTRIDESDHQVDVNGDGDMDDSHRLDTIYSNRAAWGWTMAYSSSSGGRYKIDLDKSGGTTSYSGGTAFQSTITAPTVYTPPPYTNPDNSLTPSTTWESNSPTNDTDYVNGDVYVNGDLDMNGGTTVWGDVDSTGNTQGDTVTGTITNSATPITAPDLAAMNYESIADVVVTTSNIPSYMRGQQSSSYYGSDLGDSSDHTLTHFHLGDSNGNVSSSFNATDGKLIYVKGNLWLHDTTGFTTDLPSGQDNQVTIVVEGNLFVADDLQYNNGGSGNSAILFIVKGSDSNPESYIDANKNYRYDAGETIINDGGVIGTYEGPKEGQGNVFFGDPRFGTGGVTDGYIYAQNNVYLVNPPVSASPPSGQDRIFGVKGFLSAGGIMDLGDRTSGSGYNNFRVTYDPRVQNGQVSFKGMPGALGGGFQGIEVATWREVQ